MRMIRENLMVGLLTLLLCASAAGQGAQWTGGDYSVPPGSWKQLAKLTEANGHVQDWLGWSVAISKDGNTVAVGAVDWCGKGGNGCGQGAIFVFVKPVSGWADMTETAMLTASDGRPGEYLGESVAISDDGSTIVGGAPLWPANGKGNGAAYVFVKPQSGWTDATETAQLKTTDGAFVQLGQSVAVTDHTIVAGGYGFRDLQGAAYIFVEPKDGWISRTQTARLRPSDGVKLGELGWSVSISGSTVVAGAPYTGTNGEGNGAYVFVKPNDGWKNRTETAKLTASDGTGFRLGYSVSISSDTIAVGAPYRRPQDNGAAYIFVKPVKGWESMTETARLTIPHSEDVGDVFGFAVAAEERGKLVRVGCPGCLGGKGAGFLFAEPASGCRTTSRFNSQLTASDGMIGDRLGFSVSANPTTIVAGAPYATIGSSRQVGAVYLFGQ
jgi:hypothetical protein